MGSPYCAAAPMPSSDTNTPYNPPALRKQPMPISTSQQPKTNHPAAVVSRAKGTTAMMINRMKG